MYDKMDKAKTESCKEGLWLSAMGRIVLDNHNWEVFAKPHDKKLMTKKELKDGIKLEELQKRIVEAQGK